MKFLSIFCRLNEDIVGPGTYLEVKMTRVQMVLLMERYRETLAEKPEDTQGEVCMGFAVDVLAVQEVKVET